MHTSCPVVHDGAMVPTQEGLTFTGSRTLWAAIWLYICSVHEFASCVAHGALQLRSTLKLIARYMCLKRLVQDITAARANGEQTNGRHSIARLSRIPACDLRFGTLEIIVVAVLVAIAK